MVATHISEYCSWWYHEPTTQAGSDPTENTRGLISQGSPWEPQPVDSLLHLHSLLEASKSGCGDVGT